jgi:hypothetical protein
VDNVERSKGDEKMSVKKQKPVEKQETMKLIRVFNKLPDFAKGKITGYGEAILENLNRRKSA